MMEKLWAPWRMTYIGSNDTRNGCFFCDAVADGADDRESLVLARSDKCFVMLNRYPYSNGHVMIAPNRHIAVMDDAGDDEGLDLWKTAVAAKKALENAFRPEGFNIGVNQGKVAGAGVLDHLHIHIVPRWNGDVNFMPVLADIRVIPQALEETRERLLPFFDRIFNA